MSRTHPDAVSIAARIRAREVSADEVACEAIRLIEARNPSVNAVVQTRFEEALEEVASGLPEGPLTGVPTVIKDLGASVAGLPLTNGSRLFRGAVANRDSELVARYRRAGMVILGTTNTPELGASSTTEPVLYGPTRNPWLPTNSTGGSSGGSAAAVAAGLVPVAHGNDGGGSIRVPAAMCGLFGLKPSRGRVPNAPFDGGLGRPLTVNHALTLTVRDSATLLDIAAGAVPGDLIVEPPRADSYASVVSRPPPVLKIAASTATKDGVAADQELRDAVSRAAGLCSDLGHDVEHIGGVFDFERAQQNALPVQLTSLLATVEARLAALGRPLEADDLEPETHDYLERARSLSALDVVAALNDGQEMAWEIARELASFDVLLTPTLPALVPSLGELDDRMYHAFASVWNMTGQPAMSLPLGHSGATGLPLGVQFVGRMGAEDLLLRLAGQLEENTAWTLAPDAEPLLG